MGIIRGNLSSTIEPLPPRRIYRTVSTNGRKVRFEWDPAKAIANEVKHHVSFADAILVFDDPLAQSIQDRHEGGEERWQTTGMIAGVMLIVVAHTVRDEPDGEETVRMISARRATKAERRYHEQKR